jgi:hypothetical protein
MCFWLLNEVTTLGWLQHKQGHVGVVERGGYVWTYGAVKQGRVVEGGCVIRWGGAIDRCGFLRDEGGIKMGGRRHQYSPLFSGHGDSQTVVLFPPKTPPRHFTIKKFCAMSLTFTSALPLN